MKRNGKRLIIIGVILVVAFAIWTKLVQTVDVQSVCQNGTDVGFATFNNMFHKLTGVHMSIYIITDWLGLVPVFVCMVFAVIGSVQLVKRRSLFKIDYDIIFLGIYYVVVIFFYLSFEELIINYRPILIEGRMEASYPSSTTLLVLSVMPTLVFQVNRRIKSIIVRKAIFFLTILFTTFMVTGRLISGVHWFTDIVGSVIISAGLYFVYKGFVFMWGKEEGRRF